MIKCRRIGREPCIGIYSPSEPITGERNQRFRKGLEVLKNMGFNVKVGNNVFIQKYYMAGDARTRADDIMTLVNDPEVHILLASWGGKSCNQLLKHLDYEAIKKARKPIMGFSDACVLLNAITARTELFTFSGPNVVGKALETKHADLSILFRDPFKNNVNLLGNTNAVQGKILRGGIGEGRLVGGNLSTFVLGVLGTDFMPQFSDVIFFWESAGETPQIIDQFLTCLANAGIFDRITGMVVGDFIRQDSEAFRVRDPFEMVLDVLNDYKFPILYCPTFGHGPFENPILPIGALCRLDADSATLVTLEPVVEE